MTTPTVARASRPLVHVAPYYPPHLGGVEQRAKFLVDSLVRRGRQVQVVTTRLATHAAPRPSRNVNPQVVRVRATEVANTPIQWALPWALARAPRQAIVHIHIAQAFVPEVAALVARLRRMPYIAHYRIDLEASGRAGRLLPAYKKHVLRRVLTGAARVIVLTPDYADLAAQRYGVHRSRIRVIPNATTFTRLPAPRPAPAPTPRLLFVGRLAAQKDPLLFVDLVAEYRRRYGPVVAEMIGEGDLEAPLRQHIRQKGLEQIIELSGRLEGEQLEAHYEQADLFVLSSTGESFGTVLIEAMAKGLPIVAGRLPAVRNVVQNNVNAVLTERSADAMATACHDLLADPQRYRVMSEANLKAVGAYDWEEILDATEGVYDEL